MSPIRAPLLCALLLTACGESDDERERPAEQASEPEPVECTSPTQVLIALSASGTHGSHCAESISIACDASVRVTSERPCSSVLVDRPGTHEAHLQTDRIPQLQSLAARLSVPVGTPSLPPQGYDLFVTAPVNRPLRDGPADSEASALYNEILALIEMLVPIAHLTVALRPAADPQLVLGTSGLIVMSLRSADERTVHLGAPMAITVRRDGSDEVWFESPPAVLVFAHVDGTPWDASSLAPGEEVIAGVRVTPTTAGGVSLVAELTTSARVRANDPPNERRFASERQTFEVAAE